MNKWREFWICGLGEEDVQVHESPPSWSIDAHVVEIGALEAEKARAAKLVEALETAKFDLQMTKDTGGLNERAIPLIDQAIAQYKGES